MGLHSASDGGGNPDEEEEALHHSETPGEDASHSAEEPVQRVSVGQDFQF